MVSTSDSIFSKEELKNIDYLKMRADHIEVLCGCTSKKYGDTVGKLRVYADGQFLIYCECIPDCSEKKITPYDFEKHSQREGGRKWTNHIWVHIDDQKVPLNKTPLLKYYKHASNQVSKSCRGTRVFHRDEFIRCSKCRKERRFRLLTENAVKNYHNALANAEWTCELMASPFELSDKLHCEVEEERGSRKIQRGCLNSFECEGCAYCVCFGCRKCRFVDCRCAICVDFMQNANP